MAGYIMTFDSLDSLYESARKGIYSTKITIPSNQLWHPTTESTVADYATMKEGDNIFFFKNRKIYGVGEMKNIVGDCKFLNFPEANTPEATIFTSVKNEVLNSKGKWKNGERELRWICTFKPSPYFFKNAVDMDAVLMSNPTAFKMLRAFQQLSFIKIDDIENQALKDIIFKVNEENIIRKNKAEVFENLSQKTHAEIRNKAETGRYTFGIKEFLDNSALPDKTFRRETTLELALLHQLSSKDKGTINIFGDWDYISHQVVASPFKPIIWMDKMDIFGYRYIDGYKPTISKFMAMELKKKDAEIEDVNQVLKYVDWIKNEYSYGDYSMVSAFLVASNFPNEVIMYIKENGSRRYTTNLRDDRVSEEWRDIKLVKYSYNSTLKKVEFEIIPY
ncbi:PDDEXK family nuclease [Bacillus alkalisoli]|uniref:endonuclease NucS n=1 Tax=Bacillus alkalisoli TaxID=2011008 RepID=UPI0018E1E410|nr:endonuclease NucS [Bacillus alkalisoli]